MLHRHSKLSFAGSIHFITTSASIRGAWFTEENHCKEILTLFENYREKAEVECIGYVLMPDHFHALLYQEEEGEKISYIMSGFKSLSSRHLRPENFPQKNLWNTFYDDVPVPGTIAARTKLEYIHYNPVKAGLVEKPEHYKWSSARDYMGIEEGIVKVWLVG